MRIIAFLKLIRFQNLLIIAFTQYMVRWCIIYPAFRSVGETMFMTELQFFLLSLSTVMIAAAGYAINDYFDVRIDRVNKPERMLIDKGVKRRVAIGAHSVINICAMILGLYVSWSVGNWKLVIFHFICATGLWFYSTTFKREFFIGNFVIALFTAFVPLVVGVYELSLRSYFITSELHVHFSWNMIFALSFFAFMSTLLREIIKDIEDYEGDKEFGCSTMPIVLGIKASKNLVILLCSVMLFFLIMFQISLKEYGSAAYFFIYGLIPVQLVFLYLIWKVKVATEKQHFRFAGNTAKFLMLLGVCYLLIFAFK